MGGLACFGVLPLRLMGAEVEAIGRNGGCRDVCLMICVKSRVRCRCHCGFGDAVSVHFFFAMPRQLYRFLSNTVQR